MTELAMERAPLRETDRAYLAGIVDYSSSISMHRARRRSGIYRYPVLEIRRLKSAEADWLKERFPGFKRRTVSGLHALKAVGVDAAAILVESFGYLLRKKGQAKIVFEMARTIGNPDRRGDSLRDEQARLDERLAKAREG